MLFRSTYQMKADAKDVLLHTYYGEKTDSSDKSLLIFRADRGFSGNPYEVGKQDRTYSLDSLPQEYSSFGMGDYRITSLRVQNKDGSQAAELRYAGYRVEEGKYGIPGLPAVHAEHGEAETLVIRLADAYSGLEAELYYGILEEMDVITSQNCMRKVINWVQTHKYCLAGTYLFVFLLCFYLLDRKSVV